MDSLQALSRQIIMADNVNNYNHLDETDDTDEEVVLRNRTRTDLPFLVVHGLFLFLLVFCISYCMVYGDVDRLIVGYDSCGNVCGKLNTIDYDFQTPCRAEDMTSKPFLQVATTTCVEHCSFNDFVIGHRCIPSNHVSQGSLLESIGRDLHTCSSELIGLSFLALGLAFVMFLVLRFMTAAFVWTTLFGVVVACAALAGYLWYLTEQTSALLPLAIFVSICVLIILLVILFLRKRIELVIQLLKEAGKSISAIPLLVLEPLLTFVALGLFIGVWVYFILCIESAGVPIPGFNGIKFHQNGLINFARWFNIFIMLWMIQFIHGCQNMIVAGAVGKWYFTRNKRIMNKALFTSFQNMFVYHLGTISAGSLIIAVIQMLRFIMRCFRRYIRYPLYLVCLCCVYHYIETCLDYLEGVVKYLTKNAYIITAIRGTSFIESGTKAFQLLVDNVFRIIAITSVGDFVFFFAKVLVILSTVLVGVALIQNKPHVDNMWAVLLVVGIVSFLIAHCFTTVYEMAVDTLFVCFCEDCSMNDGMARPYYMSVGLMEFVEKSKVVLKIKNEETVSVAA